MRLNRLKTIVVILTLQFFNSCYEDKGNYDYTPLGKISVSNLEVKYKFIYLGDNIVIKPNVKSSDPNDVLDYLWYSCGTPPGSSSVIQVFDTLAQTKDLDIPSTVIPGEYNFVLRIKNQNGYSEYVKVPVTIASEFSEGFYIMKRTSDHKTEIDFVLNNGLVTANVLTKVHGAPLNDTPEKLGAIYEYSYVNELSAERNYTVGLCVMTNKNINMFCTKDMSLIFDHQSMFYGDVPTDTPRLIHQMMVGNNLLTENGLYYSMVGISGPVTGSGRFGLPYLFDKGYHISKHIAQSVNNSGVLVFDDKNSRILKIDLNGRFVVYPENPSDEYKPNFLPHKLEFFGSTCLGTFEYFYMIFQDKDNASKKYLYFLEIQQFKNKNPIVKVIELDPAFKIYDASLRATNLTDSKIIYYVNNNKIGIYSANTEKEDNNVVIQGLPSEETITYLAHKYWTKPTDLENNYNYLVVGTKKGNKYKLYMYNLVGGIPFGPPARMIEGEDDVIDLQYISPKLSRSDMKYIPII